MRMPKGQSLNWAALLLAIAAAYVNYKIAHFDAAKDVFQYQKISGLLYLAIAANLFVAYVNYKRLVKISVAPTSTIAAAAQGYIQLQGIAQTAQPFTTPNLRFSCVWYRAWTYAHFCDDPLSKRPTDVRLLDFEVSDQAFQIKDKTGVCIIQPDGAEVMGVIKREAIKNNHRYVEEFLPAGKQLYVIGHLDSRQMHYTAEAVHHEVGEVLKNWKASPDKRLKKFDQDDNGEIDAQELQYVRAAAKLEVTARHLVKNHLVYTLTKPTDKQIFLIAAMSPQALSRQYRVWSIINSVLAMLMLFIMSKV